MQPMAAANGACGVGASCPGGARMYPGTGHLIVAPGDECEVRVHEDEPRCVEYQIKCERILDYVPPLHVELFETEILTAGEVLDMSSRNRAATRSSTSTRRRYAASFTSQRNPTKYKND